MRGDPAGVISVLGSDDDVLDRLCRELGHVSDKALDVVRSALALSQQHAGTRDDDEVVDRDGSLRRIDLLVRVDVLGELRHTWKVGL